MDTGNKCNTCGNGVIDAGEECDDRNSQNGDGCNDSCKLETGYDCLIAGSNCSCKSQYFDSGGLICVPCNVACDECTGNKDTECKACSVSHPYKVDTIN